MFIGPLKMVIGPLKIKDTRLPGAKLEAECPKCPWAWFAFTQAECAEKLEAHRLDMHVPKPSPADRENLLF